MNELNYENYISIKKRLKKRRLFKNYMLFVKLSCKEIVNPL